MNKRKMRMAALVLAVCLTGTAQAALQGRDLNGSIDSFEAYYDTDLDITWLADANYAKTSNYDSDGLMTWAEANTWAAQLDINGYADWRLPTVEPINGISFNYNESTTGSTDDGFNISAQGTAFAGATSNEMAHLYFVSLGNLSYYTTTGEYSGAVAGGANPYSTLDNVGPFTNFQSDAYWSGTEYAPDPAYAWAFVTFAGYQSYGDKPGSWYALAVSPGDIAAVPEAETWVMLLAGLGLVGMATRRRRG